MEDHLAEDEVEGVAEAGAAWEAPSRALAQAAIASVPTAAIRCPTRQASPAIG